MNLEQHRQQFPSLTNKAYFNFGGQGTFPSLALEAIINAYQYLDAKGPFSLEVNTRIGERIGVIREAIASELATTPNTITLTENVTAGCNIVLWGINWQAGDQILLTDCEHPGVVAIVQELARRFDLQVSTCPILATLNQGDPVAVIAEHLQPNTRLVIISHLLWNTGQVLPLQKIVEVCHNYQQSKQQIQVLVDAAQSVGSLALNLPETKVDFYAFTGHKWLCGPAGVGGLYISPQAFSQLNPTFIGWRGINLDSQGNPISWKKDGRKFEVATSAYPQYEGLAAAIKVHNQWSDAETRYQRICKLSQYFWQQLSQISGIKCLKNTPPEAGLVSFQVTNNNYSHHQVVKLLEEKGFMLRTLANPDCIRACVHYFTSDLEIDDLIKIIQTL